MDETVQKKRVLIVEDEIAIQDVLCFFLRHNDFDVLAVGNGQEAMLRIPEYKPHLIILDLIMQPGSGWDVLHWLRDNRLTPQIPVLVISALVHLTEQMQGFEEGAIEYITKPTQPSIIVERVRLILSMTVEQRASMYRKRIAEQRRTLDRLYSSSSDEFVY